MPALREPAWLVQARAEGRIVTEWGGAERTQPVRQPVSLIPAQETASPFRSKLEARFATECLDVWHHDGTITQWWYEPFGLRLAPKTYYHPDFLARFPDGRLMVIETKGFRRDDAMVKLKVAARLFPCFQFVLATRVRGVWVCTSVP